MALLEPGEKPQYSTQSLHYTLDEPNWQPILFFVCETEPEEVDDHERQHRQPRDGQIQLTITQSRAPTMTMISRFVSSAHSKL